MGVLARAGSLAVLSFVAVGVSVAAVPFRAPGTAGVAAVAATAATQPCIPNSPAPGVLPNPPVIDATVNKQFTIFVMQGPTTQNNGSAVQHFCYVTSPAGALNYVEAPTIRVRQGGTFRMTLINRIPGGPTPLPTPRSAIIPTSDGCAWLPFDGPMPTPNPGLLPPGYFNHARVPTQPDVPWMASNDTNFHTHGWHVDPYVDNVYKSLVWAPNPNSCVYTFSIPLTQPPGTYWYHAHLHGLSYEQVGGGLAGALIVESASPSPEPAAVLLVVKNAPGVQATSVRPRAWGTRWAACSTPRCRRRRTRSPHITRTWPRPCTTPRARWPARPCRSRRSVRRRGPRASPGRRPARATAPRSRRRPQPSAIRWPSTVR